MNRPAPEPICVWLIEDNPAFRKTVAKAIDRAPGLRCGAAFARGDLAVEALAATPPPDVVLLDLGLPGMHGLDVILKFRNVAPSARVLVLTVFEDDEKIFRAICAGAAGYLLKSATLAEIGRAIQDVHAGDAPITPKIARKVLERFAQAAPAESHCSLSPREKQILELMVAGRINKEIADQLSVSIHTVDFHLRGIYSKLQVGTRSEAVAKAIRNRLV